MVCEYFLRIGGEAFCRIYGQLKASNREKIYECESNFFDCYERANEYLKRKMEVDAETYKGQR